MTLDCKQGEHRKAEQQEQSIHGQPETARHAIPAVMLRRSDLKIHILDGNPSISSASFASPTADSNCIVMCRESALHHACEQ